MTIKLNREHNLKVNHKRIYRLMDILKLKSVCRKKRKNYIKSIPEITADNILNRNFKSNKFGEKWLTDVTEMKYGKGGKAYLSAILDLADKSIVSFVLGHSNNNKLVFETFDIAHHNYPNSSPIFHSDRGYQYTSKAFKKFCTYSELESAVIEYINYYNNHRYQKRLQCMTPIEYRRYLLDSAA